MLIIGWAGADEHFLKFLADEKFAPDKTLVVSNTKTNADATARVTSDQSIYGQVTTLPESDPPEGIDGTDERVGRVGFTGFVKAAFQLDELMDTNFGWPHPEEDEPPFDIDTFIG